MRYTINLGCYESLCLLVLTCLFVCLLGFVLMLLGESVVLTWYLLLWLCVRVLVVCCRLQFLLGLACCILVVVFAFCLVEC